MKSQRKSQEKEPEGHGHRPYVYKRADELGIPVMDATMRLHVTVTKDDVVRAKKANSKQCALARSALRSPGVVAAYFFRSTAYLEYQGKLVRYQLPISVQKEIVSFDRAQIFAEGVYQLSPPPPANTLVQHRKNGQRRRKKRQRQAAGAPPSSALHAVSGVKGRRAPEPLPHRARSKYVHRTQYVRDLREPSD